MRYVPATLLTPASYRIEAGATDLDLARNVPRSPLPVHGALQATLDLERARRFCAPCASRPRSTANPSHSLEVTGDPRGLHAPPLAANVGAISTCGSSIPSPVMAIRPRVIAHLNLAATGLSKMHFKSTAASTSTAAHTSARASPPQASTSTLTSTPIGKQLLVTRIVARLRQGGQLEGTVALEPWLPSDPSAYPQRTPHAIEVFSSDRNILVRSPVMTIPVNGKVTANFKDVALDTVLDMSAPRPTAVTARIVLASTPASTAPQLPPGRMAMAAPYRSVRNSASAPPGKLLPAKCPRRERSTPPTRIATASIELRKLEIHLPQSDIEAHG